MKKESGSVITLVVASVLLGVCQLAWSPSIPFSTDFESDTIGNEPAGFAQLGNTADPDISLDVVAAESSFTGGSQALEWLDNSVIANPWHGKIHSLLPCPSRAKPQIRWRG